MINSHTAKESYFEWVQPFFFSKVTIYFSEVCNLARLPSPKRHLNEMFGFRKNKRKETFLDFQSGFIISYNARTKWFSGKRYEYWHFPMSLLSSTQSKCAWSMNMSILCNCLFIEAIRRWNQLYAARNKRQLNAVPHCNYTQTHTHTICTSKWIDTQKYCVSILTQRCITPEYAH